MSPDTPLDTGGQDGPGESLALAASRRAPIKPWRRVLGLVLGAGILGALVWIIASQWRRIPDGTLRPNWWLVALAFALSRLVGIGTTLRWLAVVRTLGGRLSVARAFVVNTYAMLGRYVPGKVAMVAARVYLCTREGVSLRIAAMSALYDQVLNMLTAAIIVAVWLSASEGAALAGYRWVSVAAAAAGVVCLHPRILTWAARLAARLLRRDVKLEKLSYPALLRVGSVYVGVWALQGATLYLFVIAFVDLPIARIVDCAGMAALALMAGLLCLIAPSGIGVHEGVMAAMLSVYMPLPLAAAIALALRLLATVGELSFVGVALALQRWGANATRAVNATVGPPDGSSPEILEGRKCRV